MNETTYPIRFGIQSPQQNTSWPDILTLWRELDDLGFDSAWLFDHFLPIFSDPTGPCMEGWTTLAALAMATDRVRLGLMVTGNTYRHPAVLAKMATTVDIISGGRLILGVGAGWFELEHRAYGIPFPRVAERLRRLEETLEIIRRLWTEERANFSGKYHSVENAVFNPKPVQKPHPTILVGAAGEKLALRIVARHAQMWNSFGTPEVFLQKIAILDEHCRQIGRDPVAIEKSVLLPGLLPLDEAARRIEEYIAVGVTHLIFSVNPSTDRPLIRQFARDIMPAFRQSRT
jgi:F420-dependent oxidoreductase-like protein